MVTAPALGVPYGAAPRAPRLVPPQPYAHVLAAPVAHPQAVLPPRPMHPGAGALPQGLPTAAELARASPVERQHLLGRLVTLSPAQIDMLPHDTKVQLLDF